MRCGVLTVVLKLRRMRARLFAAVTSATLLLAGCAIPARRLEVADVRLITQGMQRAAVEKRFGAPYQSLSGSDGRTVAHYDFSRVVSSRGYAPDSILVRSLSVLYDTNG